MVSLSTHRDICCIGANVDAAAITDLAGFRRCLAEGFGEVLGLHPGAAAPVQRV